MSIKSCGYQLDICIKKGATFTLPITYKDDDGVPIDLTGYSAKMQIRSSPTSTEVIVDLTTENGGIIIDEENGLVTAYIDSDATAALDALANGAYDFFIFLPGATLVYSDLYGAVKITERTTKWS
jgi:hypothetical protein